MITASELRSRMFASERESAAVARKCLQAMETRFAELAETGCGGLTLVSFLTYSEPNEKIIHQCIFDADKVQAGADSNKVWMLVKMELAKAGISATCNSDPWSVSFRWMEE